MDPFGNTPSSNVDVRLLSPEIKRRVYLFAKAWYAADNYR
jgi:hypothetical protein